MGWWRSFLAEVFPSWHERRLLREVQAGSDKSFDALERLRRKIALQSKAESLKPARHTREPPLHPNCDNDAKPPRDVAPEREHLPAEAAERATKGATDRGAV